MGGVNYKVNVDKAYARTAMTLSAKKIEPPYTKGSVVIVYKQSAGEYGTMYGKLHETKDVWMPMSNLTPVTSSTSDKSTFVDIQGTTNNEDTDGNQGVFSATENTDTAKNDSIYGTSNSSYRKLLKRYVRAFGSPPKFTEEVDPQYYNVKSVSAGRSMLSTWYSDPAILSICPGTVSYMPGFSKKDKNTLFNKIRNTITNDTIGKLVDHDNGVDGNGKLYEFRSAYSSYMSVVNLMARTASNLLGIGNVKDLIFGTSKPLNKFDYGYYTSPSNSDKADSIFAETKRALSTAVSDSAYIHFFVNQGGVSYSDSFTTSDEESLLESKLGGSSDLARTRNNLQFLFGNVLTQEAENDLIQMTQDAGDSQSFIGGLTTIAKNYIKGGNLVFPKIIAGSNYEKSIRVELSFTSIYGDRRSIFKYTILPAIHLIAMSTPKQLSNNMYTYPYLVRCYERGNMNCDLAYIHSLDLSRGGSDNTSWTVDGLPTEITASFTITPLYSNMMVTSGKNPFMFMNNTALMEYLGTMCGTDLKSNNLNVKVQIAKNLLENRVYDIPTDIQRGLTDSKIMNGVRDFMSITN